MLGWAGLGWAGWSLESGLDRGLLSLLLRRSLFLFLFLILIPTQASSRSFLPVHT